MADRIIEYQINYTIGASVYSDDFREKEDGSLSTGWGRMKNINELIDYLKYEIYVDRSSLVVYKMIYEIEPGIRYPNYDSDGKICGYSDSSRYRLVDKVKYYPKNSEIRESKTNRNTKNTVKLNESQLRKIVAECVKRVLEEDGGSIHIKEKNRGKFNATKERTGKSTEELTHSKNPLTRKRAVFAQNAKKWNKKK